MACATVTNDVDKCAIPMTQDVAERIGREALRRHYTPTVLSCQSFVNQMDSLPSWPAVLWVVSTTGQGEPPAMLRALWRALLRRSLPPNLLANQQVAVFGLGDSGYTQYNVVAKRLYRRLEALGAHMLVPEVGLGDDRASGGYELGFGSWMTQVWTALCSRVPLESSEQSHVRLKKERAHFAFQFVDTIHRTEGIAFMNQSCPICA